MENDNKGCQYWKMSSEACGRETLPGDEYCIFHSHNENKNHLTFMNKLNEWIGICEKNTDKIEYDFQGFNFPRNYSFSGKHFEKTANFKKAVFNGMANFLGTSFGENAIFSKVVFKKEVDFASIFEGCTSFYDTRFEGDVNFYGSMFKKDVNFQFVYFGGNVDFNKREFHGKVDFRNGVSENYIDFRNAVFKEKVDFSEFTFNKKVDFSGCRFEKAESDNKNEIPLSDVVYYFNGTTFKDDAIFMHTFFRGYVRFDHAKFFGKTDFRQSYCQREAEFVICEFHGEADFRSRTFLRNTLFHTNQFFDNATFEKTKFKGDCGFIESSFENKVNFSKLIFNDKAIFIRTVFKGEIDYNDTIFCNEAVFNNCRFYGESLFTNTAFKNYVTFRYSAFSKDCRFTGSKDEKKSEDNLVFSNGKIPNDLRNITFSQPDKVVFSLVDLSNCMLDDTNILRTNLENITWNERKDRNCIYSTDDKKKKPKKSKKLKKSAKLKQTEQYYLWERTSQQLKYSYNLGREDELAGDFHYWELYFRKKRLLSQGKITDYFYWLMIVLYDKLFAFGESFIRPAAVFLVVLGVFTVGYCFWGEYCGVTSNGKAIDMDVWKAITMSLKGSFRDKIRISSGAFEIVSIINTIVNVIFVTLIVMAVRRKLKR